MEQYKAEKGIASLHILLITILFDIAIIGLSIVINTYILSIFIKVFLIAFNAYQIYYLLISKTIRYIIEKDKIIIKCIFGMKNIKISIKDILDYNIKHEKIEGIKLTGYSTKKFALGRFVIKGIGTARMFVTSNENVIYLKTNERWYGLSPQNFNSFKNRLEENVSKSETNKQVLKTKVNLHKDKYFMIPFIIVSILIIIYTLHPFILYLRDAYVTGKMPLAFNTSFVPIKWGTPKQFAFKQMAYGSLNMGILFCVYYISYFYGKYDKKVSYKFIYIELVIIIIFIVLQIKEIELFNVASVIMNFQGMI